MRIDLSLTRQAVFASIKRRMAAGESVTLDAIATEMDCDLNTVWRAVRDLKRAGVLRMTQRGARHIPTQYEILTDPETGRSIEA
jgi:DNA-binding transcriptional regulator YhcF (GntR family)